MEIKDILEKYPNSEIDKFGDWLELRFRPGNETGCFKIAWTQETVKNCVKIILKKYFKN